MVNKMANSFADSMKELSYNHEFIATCYHEAGHTISGFLNYLIISEVGIEMTKASRSKELGFTHFDSAFDVDYIVSDDLANRLITSELRINYGGLAAEKIFYKDICGSDQLPMVLKSGSFFDRERVSEIIKKYDLAPPGKKRHLLKKRLLAETHQALEIYWSDVKLISHALFNRRRLYYSDLKELLTKKSSNKTFWKKQLKSIEMIFEAGKVGDENSVYNIIFS